MKIVVAPDSFKGTIAAQEVAQIIKRAFIREIPDAQVLTIPVSDGGDGMMDICMRATRGRYVSCHVEDPLGRVIHSCYGVSGDGGTAIIELARASGLTLVQESQRQPLTASTYGTGQLIKHALEHGCRKIILGLGGSATNDGGAGMVEALGVKFLDANGQHVGRGGACLSTLKTIDTSALMTQVRDCDIIVACDVDIVLCGANGAANNYARQKGASQQEIIALDAALRNYAAVASSSTAIQAEIMPGSGAAGGTAAAALYFLGARLTPGAQLVLDIVGFDEVLIGASVVITGEGCTDFQTAQGKAPAAVAKRAKSLNIPVFCLSGALDTAAFDLFDNGLFDALFSCVAFPDEMEKCLQYARENLYNAARNIARTINTCRKIRDE